MHTASTIRTFSAEGEVISIHVFLGTDATGADSWRRLNPHPLTRRQVRPRLRGSRSRLLRRYSRSSRSPGDEPRSPLPHAGTDQFADLSQRCIRHPVVNRCPIFSPRHKPDCRKASEVLGDVLPSDVGPLGQLSDGQLASIVKNTEDAESGRIAEEGEAASGLLEESWEGKTHARDQAVRS